MTDVRKIHVDWYAQHPPRFNGGPQLCYQGDHLSNMVVFDRAPELPNYYLLVEMKTDDAGPVVTLPEIRLEGPYWVIPNYYTQICQKIAYQVCCKTESGDFEHHSAKFEGTILPVIKHNGEPIDQSPMFDPYIDILDKRMSKLILDADVKEVDSELKSDSGNPVQNRVIKAKIDEIDENAIALNGRLVGVEDIIGANSYTFTEGGYITTSNTGTTASLTPVTNSAYAYAIVPCVAGQKFVVTATTDGNGGRRPYMFINTAYNVLLRYTDGASITDAQATAPADGYLVVNSYKASAHNVDDYVEATILEQIENIKTATADATSEIDSKTGLESTTWTDGYYIACNIATLDVSAPVASTHFSYMVLDCVSGEKFTVKTNGYANLNTARSWCFVDENGKNLAVENVAVSTDGVVTAPEGAAKLVVNTYDRSAVPAHVYRGVTGNGAYSETAKRIEQNGVNEYLFKTGYITSVSVGATASLTPTGDRNWCHVAAQCIEGEPYIVTATTDGNSGRRVVIFLDTDLKCISRYTDSASVESITFTAPADGYIIVNSYNIKPHKVISSYTNNLHALVRNTLTIDDILKAPLTTLTPNFLGTFAYRQLGSLSKGYICLITDDGKAGLATDTIPFAIQKNIPMTFAVWSTSDVFLNDSYKATVLDAVQNHGCSLAQHGGSRWDDKSEKWLNEFFDSEAAYWESIGADVKGAVIPGHWTNELIKAVCGGRFGVVRSGGAGTDYDTQKSAGTVTNFYQHYTSGERSNIFCLSSYNCAVDAAIGNDNAQNKAAIDYAFANNKILIAYWHENQMDANRWAAVGSMVDYAKAKGIEFVTLGQIPYLL